MGVIYRGLYFFTANFVAALLFFGHASAASLQLTNDPSTGSPGKFAAEEIQREATGKDIAVSITLTVEKNAAGASQSYRIEREGDKLRVIGGDATGAMYGGLDVAEAIRTGTVDSLKNSDHKPHIERGIKFNIPLDLRTPSYSDNSTSAQANIPEMWSLEFWQRVHRPDGARPLQRAHALEHASVPLHREGAGVSEGRAG